MYIFSNMSKKKEKSVLQVEMENELSRASGDSGSALGPELKSFFDDMLRQQASQHSQLINVIKDNTETSSQAVLTAVQEAFIPAQPPSGPANTTPDLFTPAEDPFVELEDCSSAEEDYDFEGWQNPSGKISSEVNKYYFFEVMTIFCIIIFTYEICYINDPQILSQYLLLRKPQRILELPILFQILMTWMTGCSKLITNSQTGTLLMRSWPG